MTEYVLNVEGLNCPLPILKTKKALTSVPSGKILEVRSTDPWSVVDFTVFCHQTGNELVNSTIEGNIYRFEIKRR